MDNKVESKKQLPTKKGVLQSLALSPAREEVVLYEKGRASDISKKLKDMGSQFVTVLVMNR